MALGKTIDDNAQGILFEESRIECFEDSPGHRPHEIYELCVCGLGDSKLMTFGQAKILASAMSLKRKARNPDTINKLADEAQMRLSQRTVFIPLESLIELE